MTTLIRQIPVFVFQNLCVCVLLLLEFNLDNPCEASCTYSSDLLSPASAQLLSCSAAQMLGCSAAQLLSCFVAEGKCLDALLLVLLWIICRRNQNFC